MMVNKIRRRDGLHLVDESCFNSLYLVIIWRMMKTIELTLNMIPVANSSKELSHVVRKCNVSISYFARQTNDLLFFYFLKNLVVIALF